VRACSECGASLNGKGVTTKTCSPAHRAARSRRIKREKSERIQAANRALEYTPEQNQVRAMVEAKTDVVRDVIRDEVTPIVRESLTEAVLVGIQQLVAITPKMIAAIEADLDHPDDNVRQKAYTLLARYTLGNPSVAPQPQTAAAQPMTVHFNMPRPGGETEPGSVIPEATAIEIKECVECKIEKEETQFVGNSDRCQECHDKLQALVMERFGE
jgi:hypothetical protein